MGKQWWSWLFEYYMKNRARLGAMRYGYINEAGKPAYDRIYACKERIGEYVATGNTGCLVDAANLLMLEFEEGEHPNKHFKSVERLIHIEGAEL